MDSKKKQEKKEDAKCAPAKQCATQTKKCATDKKDTKK